MPDRAAVTNHLAAWCTEHGATYTDISDLSGYSLSYVSLIASGKRDAPGHVKLAIARALGTRVRNLFPPPPREAVDA
jgi:hypothetical protein